MTARELAKWIVKTVKFQVEHAKDSWNCICPLDGDFAVHIGWERGFDPDDEFAIHASDQPEYCLCIKIAENRRDEFEWCYMPWFKGTAEVWDTDTSLSNGKYAKDYYSDAKWLLKQYREIRKAYANGILTLE